MSTEEVPQRPGAYRPSRPLTGLPFRWPPTLKILTRWLVGVPGFIVPWNALFLVIAALWTVAPGLQRETSLPQYFLFAWARNALAWIGFAGALHLWFHGLKRQGMDYKYFPMWGSTGDRRFLFSHQLYDNLLWSTVSGVTIWTAYETLSLVLTAQRPGVLNGSAVSYAYYALLFPLFIAWFHAHFYVFHRLLHWAPLYKRVHYLHHLNVNVGPFSGLAMHPVEHLVYFSPVILLWLIPADPVHIHFALVVMALSPAIGHNGFHAWKLGKRTVAMGDYFHFLHHRLYHVNFGTNLIPLDLWFGTFHDGSPDADRRLRERLRKADTTS